MVAHGASQFNKGRLLDASDSFTAQICKKCGLFAAFNNIEHIHIWHNYHMFFSKIQLPICVCGKKS